MIYRVLEGSTKDYEFLERFLRSAGNSLVTFRYFARRPVQVIDSHIYTAILVDDQAAPLAYGHLDSEGSKVWLGICVLESVRGRGIGRSMMEHLIGEAAAQRLPSLWLKVDAANTSAIALYQKMGFVVREEQPGVALIMERS
jgi:ribosomal protein S18 acetylase RimI-like enzyme